MATIKFSDFTNQAVDVTNTRVVGFKVGDTSANYKYSMADLATALSTSIPTIYSADSALTGAREVDMDGNNLTFTYGTGAVYPSINMGIMQIFPNGDNGSLPADAASLNGNIHFIYGAPYYAGISWASFNTGMKAWYISMYGGGGWSHYQGYSVIGPDYATISSGGALTAKLGIIGLHNDNTSYAFRVQNSDLTDIFHVNNDTLTTVEKNLVVKGQAYTELYDTVNITLTVDWNNSNIQEITSLTGAHVFTASNPKIGATYILTLGQTGAVTPTWTGVKWPAATAPTLSGAGKTDIITLVCYDATGAGLYYGSSTLNFTT